MPASPATSPGPPLLLRFSTCSGAAAEVPKRIALAAAAGSTRLAAVGPTAAPVAAADSSALTLTPAAAPGERVVCEAERRAAAPAQLCRASRYELYVPRVRSAPPSHSAAPTCGDNRQGQCTMTGFFVLEASSAGPVWVRPQNQSHMPIG